MADNNENKQTVEEILAAAIERQHCQRPPRTITPEQLKAMAAERQRQKRRRLLRTAGFAAVFVIAVISTALIFNMITVDVGADKNAKEEIRTENGVVIEDGGWGSSSEDRVVITEQYELESIKAVDNRFIRINYVPSGFKFQKLIVERNEVGDIICEYFYYNKETDKLIEVEEFIPGNKVMYFEIDNAARILEFSKGEIYIYENENKRAIMQVDDGRNIKLWGDVSDEEIIKIYEGIEF